MNTVILAALRMLQNNEYVKAARQCNALKSLKCIFVDEAQDLSEIQFRFVVKIKELIGCSLILVGDPNQSIYQFQDGSDRFLLSYPGQEFALRENYRSTENIVKFAQALAPNKCEMIASRNVKGAPVDVNFMSDVNKIESKILKELSDTCFQLHEIAIIGPVKLCKEEKQNIKNLGLSLIINLLNDKNVSFIKQYCDSDSVNKEHFEIKEGHVNLLTIHGSKGLEFKKVILLNFNCETQGIVPTESGFNYFKYLWHVAVSRAQEELSIYALKLNGKHIWPLLQYVPDDVFKLNITGAHTTLFPKIIFREKEYEIENYTVTEFLKQLTPETQFTFENLFDYEVEENPLFEIQDDALPDFVEKNSALYGLFFEQLFAYENFLKHLQGFNLFQSVLQRFELTLHVPKKFIAAFNSIKGKLSITNDTCLCINFIDKHKESLDQKEIDFLQHLKSSMNYDFDREFFLQNPQRLFGDSSDIMNVCREMIVEPKKNYVTNLFQVVLYKYHLEHEAKYLLNNIQWEKNLQYLKPWCEAIKKFVEDNERSKELRFWVCVNHPNFPIRGEIDILTQEEIIDMKFCKSFQIEHVFQLLLYYNSYNPDWSKNMILKIWNLRLGKEYAIKIKNINNFSLLRYLCDTTKIKLHDLLFVYDLETTCEYASTCDIIERYFVEYNLNFVLSQGLVQEIVPQKITDLTGITQQMVNCEGDSPSILREEISDISEKYFHNPGFMAHNGSSFDHKILVNKGYLDPNKVKFLDSKTIIRMLAETDTYSMDLTNTYKTIMKCKELPGNAHRADSDVNMLLEILREVNFEYPSTN